MTLLAQSIRHLLCLIVFLLPGCASTHGHWGKNALRWPTTHELKTASQTALQDQKTWIPALGATLFSLGDFDQRASRWATANTPVFGSVRSAQKASDHLQDIGALNYWLTALIAETGEATPGSERAQGLLMGHAAIGLTRGLTAGLKSLSGRPRPSGGDTRSFPSGHTSNTTAYASLSANNLRHTHLNEDRIRAWQFSAYSVAALTGWARVEAEKHYPSDVLFGFALGNFVGSLFNQLFLNPRPEASLTPSLQYELSGHMSVSLRLNW